MSAVVDFDDVSFVRNATNILKDINWKVHSDQRWVILGPNGAGKTTLLQLAAAMSHPTSGQLTILGQQMGKTDLAWVKPRVGFCSSVLAQHIPRSEKVIDVVLTAAYGQTGRWKEQYENIDQRRAERILREWNIDHLKDREFGTLSEGEQKRVQIARAVMTDPEVLFLDEPTAGLDVGGREELLSILSQYAQDPQAPAIVMVTHHVEEIPVGFNQAALLSEGELVHQGAIDEVITSERLSDVFGMNLIVDRKNDRHTARIEDFGNIDLL